uniref:RHS repeat-associated core domain-containing protein n=1 Tax=Noviherbaspirillum aerium TaxID=2588497 RepID=UPI00178C299A
PVELTDAAGRRTGYRHDALGRLIAVEQPDGAITRIAYDPQHGKPSLITDAMGGITALRHDEAGNLASITDALGQRTAYRYGAHGLPVVITDAAGRSRTLAYNEAGQVIRHTDCSRQTTRYDYDGWGQLSKLTDALGQSTSYRYDAAGRLLAVTRPDGSEEQLEYDRAGRLVAQTDAAGRRTVYALDAEGLPTSRTDALGHTLHYRYDAARRLAQLINENGAVYAFSYDVLDRLHEETGFDGRLTRYRYDAAGLPVAREEHGSPAGAGVTGARRHADARIDTHYQRDAAGRLLEKIVSRITGPSMAEQLRTRYRYDKLGRLVQASNAQAEVELQYDAIGQLIAEATTARHHASRITHAYDALGNRIQTVLPDGRQLNQLFYGSGHLHQVNLDGQVICDIERDGLHREISRSQGPLKSLFQYDRLGRLTGQQVSGSLAEQRRAWQALDSPELDGSLITRRYDYDKSGELIAIDDARLGRTAYHYDALGRILSAVHPTTQERFDFDPAHNLLDDGLQNQGGRIENNRVTVFEDKRYAYDVHGDLTGKKIGRHTEIALQGNGEHQLVRATTTRQAHTDQPTVQTVTYGYDPFGRRLYKKDAFGITHFVWDGNRLLEEVRGGHARTYLYQPESFVPLAQVNRVIKQDDEAEKVKQTRKQAAQVLHMHTDHLGTPREMTDEQGQLRWAATYRAWGNVLRVEVPEVFEQDAESAQKQSFEEVQPLRFQGQYYDAETGLHYNRFRYYDPDCGRFVGQDPIGLAGGNNVYQYAPNPLSWVDPLGLRCICDKAKQTPIWSTTKKQSSAENAYAHWNKHKDEFPELANSKKYVDAAHAFASSPPTDALIKMRGKETLIYDAKSNTFLVKGENGAPKTMFRPKDGIGYWSRQ